MNTGNPGINGGSSPRLPTSCNREERPGHNQATGTTKKTYFFAILAIVGFGGLVVGVVGLVQVLQSGALTNQAIMMATGGAGGTLLFIIGIVGLVKNRQIGNQPIEPLETTVIEGVENPQIGNQPIEPLETTVIEGVENPQIGNQPIEPLERTVIEGVENFTVFGAREWQRFYGDVGVQPDYPEGIVHILNAQCPFSRDENIKVKNSHMLVLIPATVGGEALTLNKLRQLIQHPNNNGHATDYKYYNQKYYSQNVQGDTGINQSCWVLMTKDVIPGSRSKTYNEQKELVRRHEGVGYTLPGALEAAVCILMEHVVSSNKLFSCQPLTYTRCSEIVLGKYPVVVGGFSSVGLSINDFDDISSDNYGVGALRKFF